MPRVEVDKSPQYPKRVEIDYRRSFALAFLTLLGLVLLACSSGGSATEPPLDSGPVDLVEPTDAVEDVEPSVEVVYPPLDGLDIDETVPVDSVSVDEESMDSRVAPPDTAFPTPDVEEPKPVDPTQPDAPGSSDLTPLGPGLTVHDVALYFAPIWYQDTMTGGPDGQGARGDVPVRVHFDADLKHRNNWEGLPEHPLPAFLYYGLVATSSHYFITYVHYHPRDWEAVCVGLLTACHEGDLEDVQLVVERDNGGFGKVLLVRAHHHGKDTYWSNEPLPSAVGLAGGLDFESLSGSVSESQELGHTHVRVFSQAGGHGVAPCWAANNTIPPYGIPVVACPSETGEGFPGSDGIRYRPTTGASTVYESGMETTGEWAQYALESLLNTLWAWRHEVGEGLLYRSSDAFHYVGARKGAFQTSKAIGATLDAQQFINDSSSGHPPWVHQASGSERGDLFLDPAYAYALLLGVTDPAWSMEYSAHPYLPDVVP